MSESEHINVENEHDIKNMHETSIKQQLQCRSHVNGTHIRFEIDKKSNG